MKPGQDRVTSKTAVAWADANTILFEGELGIEIDTGRTKYGDGKTSWDRLPYAFSKPEDVTVPIDNLNIKIDSIQRSADDIKTSIAQRDKSDSILTKLDDAITRLQAISDKLDPKA